MLKSLVWSVFLLSLARTEAPPASWKGGDDEPTDSFSVVYPSGTPTVNFIDEIMFAWSATGAFTTAAVFCDQGYTGLILSPWSTNAQHTSSSEFGSLGLYFQEKTWVTKFPATCSISMWLGSPDSNGVFSASNEASTTGGGKFVITSHGLLIDAKTEYAPSTTREIIRTSSETAPASSTASSSSSTSDKTSSPASSTQSSSAETSTPPSPTPTPHSGLSAGAKAGIAVGAIVGAFLIGGLIVWFVVMRRRLKAQEKQLKTMEAANNGPDKPELAGQGVYGGGVEPMQEQTAASPELDGAARHEMYAAGGHGHGPQDVQTSDGYQQGYGAGPYELQDGR